MNSDPQVHKSADALVSQRFSMLEDIAKELAGHVSFPVCFDVAIHLRDTLRKPDISPHELIRLVRMEPLISARLLHLANSPKKNRSRLAIVEIEKAVVHLGVEVARNAAIAVSAEQLMGSRNLVVFSDVSEALWNHSLKTAAGARVIARQMTALDPDEAMTAGLMHDLGAFYMLYRASQYEELRIRPETAKHLIALWHKSIGESLMYALGLPEQIIEAIRERDDSDAIVDMPRSLGDVVFVANLLAGRAFTMLAGESGPPIARPELLHPPYLALAREIEDEYRELRRALP